MSFDVIPNLLADILQAQKDNNEAITRLAEAIAGVRAKVEKAKTETDKAIEKAAKVEHKDECPPEAKAQITKAVSQIYGKPAEPAAPAGPTYQDAAAAITKLSRTKGRDAAVALLAKFGATKLPEIKPEQFADVIAACEGA